MNTESFEKWLQACGECWEAGDAKAITRLFSAELPRHARPNATRSQRPATIASGLCALLGPDSQGVETFVPGTTPFGTSTRPNMRSASRQTITAATNENSQVS